MKLLAVLRRIASPSKEQIPRVRPFDDGLTEIARLIAREAPSGEAEVPPETSSKDKASTN